MASSHYNIWLGIFPLRIYWKNNLSCLLVLSTTCIGHWWLERKCGRLHRNERFGRHCPKGEGISTLLSFFFTNTYQLRASETKSKCWLAWKPDNIELQVQGAVCQVEWTIAQSLISANCNQYLCGIIIRVLGISYAPHSLSLQLPCILCFCVMAFHCLNGHQL